MNFEDITYQNSYLDRYDGIVDEELRKNKDNERCMEKGNFVTSVDCGFKIENVRFGRILLNAHHFVKDLIDDDLEFKYFLKNFRFNSFETFLEIVDSVEIDYAGFRLNRIYTFLNEGDSENFMKYFSNLFLCNLHELRFIFNFKENIQEILKENFKEKLNNLIFSFDVYEFNKNMKSCVYKYPQIQNDFNIGSVYSPYPSFRINFNYPGKELILSFDEKENENQKELFELMKEIELVLDGRKFTLKLTRNYKNLYIYDFIKNFGKTINFSEVNSAKIMLKFEPKNPLNMSLISYNLIGFINGMCGLVF